jgi:hypothetical protein
VVRCAPTSRTEPDSAQRSPTPRSPGGHGPRRRRRCRGSADRSGPAHPNGSLRAGTPERARSRATFDPRCLGTWVTPMPGRPPTTAGDAARTIRCAPAPQNGPVPRNEPPRHPSRGTRVTPAPTTTGHRGSLRASNPERDRIRATFTKAPGPGVRCAPGGPKRARPRATNPTTPISRDRGDTSSDNDRAPVVRCAPATQNGTGFAQRFTTAPGPGVRCAPGGPKRARPRATNPTTPISRNRGDTSSDNDRPPVVRCAPTARNGPGSAQRSPSAQVSVLAATDAAFVARPEARNGAVPAQRTPRHPSRGTGVTPAPTSTGHRWFVARQQRGTGPDPRNVHRQPRSACSRPPTRRSLRARWPETGPSPRNESDG